MVVRLENIKLKNKLKKKEHQLKSKVKGTSIQQPTITICIVNLIQRIYFFSLWCIIMFIDP